MRHAAGCVYNETTVRPFSSKELPLRLNSRHDHVLKTIHVVHLIEILMQFFMQSPNPLTTPRLLTLAPWLPLLLVFNAAAAYAQTTTQTCAKTVYLTFDTGNMSQAQFIADTLKKHAVKATFFVAHEKTKQGGYSLDASWATYYQALLADGHAFGSHTFDHVYLQASNQHSFVVKPQFGSQAGTLQTWSTAQYCSEIKRSDAQFFKLTGAHLSPLWRSPGGRTSTALLDAAQHCGYQHVGWQTNDASASNVGGAGFSGDELASQTHPNSTLLRKSLRHLRNGDVFMAHLGIWSRLAPWAPAVLEPLIVGLKQQGTCFATLPDHPDYGKQKAIQTTVKF